MKNVPAFLFSAALLLGPAVASDPVLPAALTTLTGKNYTGVTLRAVEPDGVRITHDSGFAKIKFEELPEAVRAQFSMDPEKAAAFRAEQQAEQAAAAKARAAERERIMKQQNASAPAQPEPAASSPKPSPTRSAKAALPPPSGGRIYEIDELKGKKADLAGTVVRVRLAANWASTPEQDEDGSFEVFVGGNAERDDYTTVRFPREARNYVRLFNKTSRGEMTFYALVSAARSEWLRIVGRNWNAQGQSYEW